jgi:hypothetical protein
MKLRARTLLKLAGLVLAAGIVFVLCRTPRNDRLWADEFARTATVSFVPDGPVVLKNVRDFRYGDHSIVTETWLADVRLDPAKITRAWFVLEPFGSWKAVGHTYLTFEFSDGRAFSFSIEARKEKDESYSAVLGALNQYELAYTWGTERDFLTRRILYLDHPVYMYPLTISAEQARAVFKALLVKTNELAAHPRFYNTLTANCTNLLAEIVNGIKPGAVPWSYTWYLPGHSDRFLTGVGYLAVPGDFDTQREKYNLSTRRRDILAHGGAPAFTAYVRSLLPAVK